MSLLVIFHRQIFIKLLDEQKCTDMIQQQHE